jgi:hypothetical protein
MHWPHIWHPYIVLWYITTVRCGLANFETETIEAIRRLKAQDQGLSAEEGSIRQQRAEIARLINDNETALRIFRERMGVSVARLPDDAPRLLGDIQIGTVADMAYQYLERQGGAASVTEIVDFLVDRGKYKKDGNRHGYYGTVFKTLRDDPRFLKEAGRGRFLLNPANQWRKNASRLIMTTSAADHEAGLPDANGGRTTT